MRMSVLPYQEKPNLDILPQYLFFPCSYEFLVALTELARTQKSERNNEDLNFFFFLPDLLSGQVLENHFSAFTYGERSLTL